MRMFRFPSLFRKGKKKNKKMIFASPEMKEKHLNDTRAAISTLKQTVETQEKREQHITRKMQEIVFDAKKKMAKGNKKGAINAMKKKKLYEQEIEKIENIKMTLEMQIIHLESSSQNAANVYAMKEGTHALQTIHKTYNSDQVEDLMDEIREETDNARDINDALRVPIDSNMFDDDDLLNELEGLDERSSSSGVITSISTNSSVSAESLLLPAPFPNAPSNSLRILQKKKEKDDMKKLEAELWGF